MNNRYNSFVLKTLAKFLKNGDMRCLMLSVMNENEYNEYQVHFLVLKEKKRCATYVICISSMTYTTITLGLSC